MRVVGLGASRYSTNGTQTHMTLTAMTMASATTADTALGREVAITCIAAISVTDGPYTMTPTANAVRLPGRASRRATSPLLGAGGPRRRARRGKNPLAR